MASLLDIYNQAIGACGSAKVLSDPNQDAPEARACNTYYEQSLTSTLQMGWWNFAQRNEYATLYAAAPGTIESSSTNTSWFRTDPPPPWNYAYKMPSDIIQVRMITYEAASRIFAGPQRFKSMAMYDAVQGTYIPVIVTNASRAVIVYTANVRDPALFDGQFVDTLVARLAMDMCLKLTADQKLFATRVKVWQQMQNQALTSDANEGLGFIDFIPETLAARGYRDACDPAAYIPMGVIE